VGKITSCISVDFPEPEIPVITESLPTGKRTSILFRLCTHAQRTSIQVSTPRNDRRDPRMGWRTGALRQRAVSEFGFRSISRSEPNSLRFAAAQCFCRTPQREITKSNLFHETQSLLNLGQKTGCDGLMRAFEFQPVNPACCFAGRESRKLIDGVTLYPHVTRHGI